MDLSKYITIVGRTDIGSVRDHNEDAIGAEIKHGLVVLADGMGGYNAGEVASEIAVDTVLETFKEQYNSSDKSENDEAYSNESLLLKKSIEKANKNIFKSSQTVAEHKGMGTTIVAALFYDNKISIAHVGDSRLYRLRNNQLQTITADHSLMQELINKGFYTPEEARNSLHKNLVTRALGVDNSVQVEINEDVVFVNDLFILCSDGLNDMVEDKDIEATLNQNKADLEVAIDNLIQLANDNGGKDNVSVIGINIDKPFPAKKSWFSRFTDWF